MRRFALVLKNFLRIFQAFGDPDPEVEWLHDPGPERGDLPDDFKPITISEQFIRYD